MKVNDSAYFKNGLNKNYNTGFMDMNIWKWVEIKETKGAMLKKIYCVNVSDIKMSFLSFQYK